MDDDAIDEGQRREREPTRRNEKQDQEIETYDEVTSLRDLRRSNEILRAFQNLGSESEHGWNEAGLRNNDANEEEVVRIKEEQVSSAFEM